MIDVEKWNQASDEQKLQTCVTIHENVSVKSVTKDDWLLMFKFLIEKVQG
jgi:hypothetical protein